VAVAGEFPAGSRRSVDGAATVTVWRLADGTFHATDDACAHYFWSLREVGDLDGHVVTCTVHQAKFDVRTGAPLCGPARLPLATYPVEVTAAGEVYVII
jgi:nitrite reductase/ring-hydroxylating ferredoxin subunit